MSTTEFPATPATPSMGDESAESAWSLRESRSWQEEGRRSAHIPSPMEAPLPGGKKATFFADRVRAAPAVTPTLSMILGQNAVGLGVWGLMFPNSVNRVLGMAADPNAVRLLFGARELVTAGLAADPTRTDLLWARVAGDVFDLSVLHRLDRPDNPKRSNARLAMAAVLAVGALDLIAAVRMTTVKRNCV